MPGKQEVADHLARLLDSKYLQSSPSVAKLLAHCVNNALAGEEENLKESTIGVLCFDRDPGYDTKLDPIVRVTARRLREKLELFYQGDGMSEAIRISLPKGGYVPRINFRNDHDDHEVDSRDASIPVFVNMPTPAVELKIILPVWMRFPLQSGLVLFNLVVLSLTLILVHFSLHSRAVEADAMATRWNLPAVHFRDANHSALSLSHESDTGSQSAWGEVGGAASRMSTGIAGHKIAVNHLKPMEASAMVDASSLEAGSHEAPETASVDWSGKSTHFLFVEPRL